MMRNPSYRSIKPLPPFTILFLVMTFLVSEKSETYTLNYLGSEMAAPARMTGQGSEMVQLSL